MITSKKRDGFSLVEIAIVLVAIGLIATLLVPIFVQTVTRGKISSGKYGIEAAKKEIMGYVIVQNGTLPPAGYFTGRKDPWANDFTYHPAIPVLVCGATTTTPMRVTLEDGVSEVLDVAYFLSSNGPNKVKQVDDSIVTNIRIYDPTDVVAGQAYDDVVSFVTLYQLTAKLCSQ
jgi:prepilin-type N-terminal cleavage/methylation domain-containing protein